MKPGSWSEVEQRNLQHAINNDCTDPDCEIHHPEVAIEEGSLSPTELSFYLAGFFAGQEYTVSELDGLTDNTVDELVNRGLLSRKEIYPDAEG